ncbi:hypothetical protein BCR44DRAFT_28314 [Catenaria anguillulae PL171]|uniref:C2 NT-type domain-containing protein n=1 Tax=Catenaria anguillulae PL171 TaxID=765915 RepID=A0A1Y2HY89_9FUNG|nr:hypothetical protein BCR44DRAFT_28314 [Catenaria anguillulae PL171]
MKFHNLFVPRARQLTFAADITVHSLDNVPMLSGLYYAKLKLPSHATPTPVPQPTMSDFPSIPAVPDSPMRVATTTPAMVTASPSGSPHHNSTNGHPHGSHSSLATQLHHQRHATANSNTSTTSSNSNASSSSSSATPSSSSPRTPLRDHSVTWHWRFCFDADLTKDEAGVLESWPFSLVIKLDRSEELKTLGPGAGNQATERIGVLHLDLAHFAGPKSVTTRKFLLQETRMNSTVKVTIAMTLKAGDPLFKVPELPSDMQIDLSRFTKSMIPGGHNGTSNNPHFDTPTSETDFASVIRSGSMSDNSSLYSSRITSAAHRAVTAPIPPSSHSSSSASTNPPASYLHDPNTSHHADHHHLLNPILLPSSSSGLSGHSGGVAGGIGLGGTQLLVTTPTTDGTISPGSLNLTGALPQLPNADPRPSAAIVDDLFSQVLATAKVSHHLSAPLAAAAGVHSRRVSSASAGSGSVSAGAGQVTAIYLGGGGAGTPETGFGVHARRSSAAGKGPAGGIGGYASAAGVFRPAVG